MKGLSGAVFGALFAVIFATSPAYAQSVADHPKIAPGTLKPYDKSRWPKLFSQYPEDIIFGKLQEMREKVALEAANSPFCDIVYTADIAPSYSTPPNNPSVYADCENGYRVRIYSDGKLQRRAK